MLLASIPYQTRSTCCTRYGYWQPNLGEGSENQSDHLRSRRIPTDARQNQDNYLGEAYKMRNLLELFKGDTRIVGFPEHIFSVSGGAVAHFSGSNEVVFGSTVQRFLTWPLMVRFHYGHPDVWDKVWAISSGGVAKASRTLHVSEDIFGGFNVVLRGGTIDYTEFIHVGKGRDMSFIAVNGFETKISAGGAVTSVSRDMIRLNRSFDIFRLLSFYSSMAGFYVTTLMSMWSVYLFMLCQLILCLMGLESYEQFTFADEVVADERNCTRTTAGRMARRALEGTISLAVELRNKSAIPTIDPCAVAPAESFLEVDWRTLFSFAMPQEEQSVNSGRTAADGLYDDSTGGVPQQDKQITGRFPMATSTAGLCLGYADDPLLFGGSYRGACSRRSKRSFVC